MRGVRVVSALCLCCVYIVCVFVSFVVSVLRSVVSGLCVRCVCVVSALSSLWLRCVRVVSALCLRCVFVVSQGVSSLQSKLCLRSIMPIMPTWTLTVSGCKAPSD